MPAIQPSSVRASASQQRAAAKPGTPNGAPRIHAFASELRVSTVVRNGQERVRLEGYASVAEAPYPMWDIFGEYNEVVSRGAFERTLADRPDVAFLTNHKGVTMARTTNGTLELASDLTGLRSVAYLNPERQDVRDLVTAIRDGDITEMSFAFMIDDGEWSDDFSEYRINRLNIDRGDVSAVNYGANPYTSIAARSGQILSELEQLPDGAKRAAFKRLTRAMVDSDDDVNSLIASIDANVDQAVMLFSSVDATALPAEVAQGIDLVNGADALIDGVMEALGIPDPDDEAEGSTRAGSQPMTTAASEREASMKSVDSVEKSMTPGGRDLRLIETLLDL